MSVKKNMVDSNIEKFFGMLSTSHDYVYSLEVDTHRYYGESVMDYMNSMFDLGVIRREDIPTDIIEAMRWKDKIYKFNFYVSAEKSTKIFFGESLEQIIKQFFEYEQNG